MENFISSASILTVLSLHLHEVLFKVIEHFSLLLVFYVVVWGDLVVKLHAAFIKTLITEENVPEQLFILFNIRRWEE